MHETTSLEGYGAKNDDLNNFQNEGNLQDWRETA